MPRNLRKLRPRFSLVTLFLLVTVVALSAACYQRYREVAEAREHFDAIYDGYYGWNQTSWGEVYEASEDLMDAKLAVPLASREDAIVMHLNVIVSLIVQEKKDADLYGSGGMDVTRQERAIERLAGYHEQAMQSLERARRIH